MREVNGSREQISQGVEVIDAIVFRNNILALNAALAAGGAGQVGAGFAVVADEGRTLVDRSARVANEAALPIAGCFQPKATP